MVDLAITIFYHNVLLYVLQKEKEKEKDKKFQVWGKFKVFFFKLPVEYKNNIANKYICYDEL